MKKFLLLALLTSAFSLEAFAVKAAVGKSEGGGYYCYLADASGRPYGEPIADAACHHHFQLAKATDDSTYCFNADSNNQAYGEPVDPVLCSGNQFIGKKLKKKRAPRY